MRFAECKVIHTLYCTRVFRSRFTDHAGFHRNWCYETRSLLRGDNMVVENGLETLVQMANELDVIALN